MIKFYTTLTNERGDVLPNHRVQVADSFGAIVTIYSDAGGTRFTDASGNIVNYATADARGRVSLYFEPAEGQVLQTLDAAGSLVDTEPDFADVYLSADPVAYQTKVSSVAELAALASPVAGRAVVLTAGGRKGSFAFDGSNLASKVASDTLQGVYVAPASDPTGASGAWVRNHEGLRKRCEWFGGAADAAVVLGSAPKFKPTSATGTDNSAAIQACINVLGSCHLTGNYAIGSAITLGQGQTLTCEATGSATLYTLSSFTDSAMVSLNGTRASCSNITAVVTTAVYDPVANTGTHVSCIQTTGTVFHHYIRDCRAFGGRRGFDLAALEGSLIKCVADGGYNGYYLSNYDNTLINCTAVDNPNYGYYSNSGGEVTDLHLVRTGNRAMYLNGNLPYMMRNLFIDTPSRDGMYLENVNGAQFDGIYFTKPGEGRTFDGGATTGTGTTPDYPARLFVLDKSRDNRFLGGAIYFASGVSLAQMYFASIDNGVTGLAESNRSLRNLFEGFKTETLLITDGTTQQMKNASYQRWRGGDGTFSRYNNEGYLYKGLLNAPAAGGSYNVRLYLPEIDVTGPARLSHLVFDYNTRTGASNRSAGIGVIPLVNGSDTGSTDGVFTPLYTVGTPSTFTITGVTVGTATAGPRLTRYVDFTVTNTSGSTSVIGLAIRAPLDNYGPQ